MQIFTGDPASWVIIDQTTGKVVCELFSRKLVDKLNTAKYRAIPAADYLADLHNSMNAHKSIYEQMQAAGVRISSHESDLYVPVTDVTAEIVARYDFKQNVRQFTSNTDGKRWFEIPFAFDPWWTARTCKVQS